MPATVPVVLVMIQIMAFVAQVVTVVAVKIIALVVVMAAVLLRLSAGLVLVIKSSLVQWAVLALLHLVGL